MVVATPTASGKSLIYNLPVLERHLRDSEAGALYLFPLKALAQDQLAGLQRLVSGWPEEARLTAALYDGDTSDHFRRKIRRDPPTVLISNPEMLHLALLPHHEQWAPFLAGLSHIVVDEAHTYRGVFGAHMAGVFRRLNRLAAHYGAMPSYVFCTAASRPWWWTSPARRRAHGITSSSIPTRARPRRPSTCCGPRWRASCAPSSTAVPAA